MMLVIAINDLQGFSLFFLRSNTTEYGFCIIIIGITILKQKGKITYINSHIGVLCL